MAIYTNEHLTDLLNEQYEKVRKLEKENTRLDEENHKLAYSLSQSVPVESSLEQYDRIKELEEIINSKELLRQHMNSIGYRELCKLKEELQATKEQLKKCESSLDDYAICNDVGAVARRYFKDKQKDEVR